MLQMKSSGISTKPVKSPMVPQREKQHPAQAQNNAGGFVFTIPPLKQLERFLIIGSSGGTFYASKRKHTGYNLQNVVDLMTKGGVGVAEQAVAKAVEYSHSGRVISNDTSLAVLAIASAHAPSSIKATLPSALSKVARTGTDILHFTEYANTLRGWGSGLKKLVGSWYLNKSPDQVAFQAVKYFNRDGWTQSDVLRLAHPKANTEEMNNVFKYITHGEKYSTDNVLPEIIHAFEKLKANPSEELAISLIKQVNLPREAIPTQLLNSCGVWDALLEKMPLTALIRNLNKMTAIGLLKPLGDKTKFVVEKLNNEEVLAKGRVHPIKLLLALRTYSKGTGDKGSLVWSPVGEIVQALEASFYKSFKYVEPTGKKILNALDISASMNTSMTCEGGISCREASFALAMITAKKEAQCYTLAFDQASQLVKATTGRPLFSNLKSVRPINMGTASSLLDYEKTCGKWTGGGTDCALPMIYAKDNNLDVDVFIIYTDNETWAGGVHPHVALKAYNDKMSKKAKLVVVGMTATKFSIAEPNNPDMLDVVGFDPNTPEVISSFVRGYF